MSPCPPRRHPCLGAWMRLAWVRSPAAHTGYIDAGVSGFAFRCSSLQPIRRRSYQPGACFLVRELQMLVFKCLHRHILYHVLGLPPRPSQQAGE